MTTEHPYVENRDWRLQAITTVQSCTMPGHVPVIPENPMFVEAASLLRIRRQAIRIPAAAPAAIYLSLAQKARNAGVDFLRQDISGCSQRQTDEQVEYPRDKDTLLFDALESMAACVVFSYTAVEVFANEKIPENQHYDREEKSKDGVPYVKRLDDKEQIQQWVPLNEKLLKILPSACDVKSPQSLHIWRDFRILEKIRHMLIHLRTECWQKANADDADNTVWTWLFSIQAQKGPEIALALISHYFPEEVSLPRWVGKLKQQLFLPE